MISSLRKPAEWIFFGLLLYMPFHVLLSTWAGTSFEMLTAAKILKDIVLVVGFLLALFSTNKAAISRLAKDRLVWLIGAYALLTVLLAAVKPTEQDAEVLGIAYNLRFLLFFLYGVLIMSWQDADFIKKIVRYVLAVGVVVALFGVLQYLFLPDNALSHLGYSKPNGTPPAFFIDDKPDLERVMSTVKDPNSLGSYLIIIVLLIIATFKRRNKELAGGALALAILCLWLTFSSGASRSGQEILDLMMAELGIKGKIEVTVDRSLIRPKDPPNLFGSFERINQQTGWKPTISFEQTIKDFLIS